MQTEKRKIAVVPGSFDPITLGHLDIISRTADLFDEVVVALGINSEKTYLFAHEERLRFARAALAALPNVRAEFCTGYMVDFARAVGASVLVKGVRNAADLAYEAEMAQVNRTLAPEIETAFLPCRPEFSGISSSRARALIEAGEDLSSVLPEAILDDVAAAISERA